MKHIVVIIPSRYASVRYPGKPLETLRGAEGVVRSLVEWTWNRAMKLEQDSIPDCRLSIYIATDDQRIWDHAVSFGAKVIFTPECPTGTERCFEAIRREGIPADIVINFQGDALLTPPSFVRSLIDTMLENEHISVATPCIRLAREDSISVLSDARQGISSGTTVVFDQNHRAMYFSKNVIPFVPASHNWQGIPDNLPDIFYHTGLYAFTTEALNRYAHLKPGALEHAENLEQLRFLEHGIPIHVVEMPRPPYPLWELNNPGDKPLIEDILQSEIFNSE